MKIFVCLSLIDLSKLIFLKQVLDSLQFICDEVHVAILTNIVNPDEVNEIISTAPSNSNRFKVEVINRAYEKLPSPWLLAWAHKVLMHEKFQDATYTHFMNIEDDILVTFDNIKYWLTARDFLRSLNIFPSFLRVEWSESNSNWVSVDAIEGDKFSIRNCPHVMTHDGYGYVNIPRIYQGMFLYDRELMEEYINSGKFVVDEAFPNWREAIQFKNSPQGLGEASHAGLSQINVPSGCISRNFLPFYEKYKMFDPACFIHHLPNKFANEASSGHGKVFLHNILMS